MINLIGDYILLKMDKEERQTESGLEIVRKEEKQSTVGTIVSMGNGRLGEKHKIKGGEVVTIMERIPITDVKIGDKVLVPVWAGERIIIENDSGEDEEMLLVKHPEILAVVEQ